MIFNITPYIATGLPFGYSKLGYIESSGTQYIDTGFAPNQNTRVVMDIDVLSTSSATAAIFGGRDGGSSNTFTLWKISNTAFRTDYVKSTSNISVTPTGRHRIDKNQNITIIDDTNVTQTKSDFQSSNNLCLFAVLSNGTVDNRMIRAKLYSCQIYDNDVLIRDFIPCKNLSGEKGLYDVVTKTFYGNFGTGTMGGGDA